MIVCGICEGLVKKLKSKLQMHVFWLLITHYCFRERRHAEVEADKKQAEAAHSAVKIKNEDEAAAAADGAADFRGFAPGERRGGTPGAAGKARVVPGGAGAEAAGAGARARSSRLSDRDKGPPPDPGYKYVYQIVCPHFS